MFVLMARFTLSMKTSNSSRNRIGDPIASHTDKSMQIDENDFSPPDKVLVFRPAELLRVSSGSTWIVTVLCLWFKSMLPRNARSLRR
jgi:hypothetical protein